MVRIKGPLLGTHAAGTLASTLIYRRGGRGHTAYPYFKPLQPGTDAQAAHQTLFSAAAATWSSYTDDQKDAWNAAAAKKKITPYNAYLSVALRQAEPPPPPPPLLPAAWDRLSETEQAYWDDLAEEQGITPYQAYLNYNVDRLNLTVLDDLVAWWANHSPTGSTYRDLTGNAHEGTFVGLNPPTVWVDDAERAGYVLRIPGAGHVTVPSKPTLTDPFTVALWFQQYAFVQYSSFIDLNHADCWMAGNFYNNYLRFFVHGEKATTAAVWGSDFDWHHYCGLWTGTQIKIYIDGALKDTVNQSNAPGTPTYFYLGTRWKSPNFIELKARLDDMRIYSRVLTVDEIQNLAGI